MASKKIKAAKKNVKVALKTNMMAITFFLSNRSAKYPLKGGTRTLGIICRNVTKPTFKDDPDMFQVSHPIDTIKAHVAAPPARFALHKIL